MPSEISCAAADRQCDEHTDPRDDRRATGPLPPVALLGGLVRPDVTRAEERGEASAAAHLQGNDLGVRDVTRRRDGIDVARSTPTRRGARPTSARTPAMPLRARPVKNPTTSSTSVSSVVSRNSSGSRRAGAEGEDGAHPMAGAQRLVREIRATLDECLEVSGTSGRDDDDAGAAAMRAPAEVEVLAVERHRPVEAAERAEEVGAHEHAGRRHAEDVAHRVVLLLVDLPALDDRVDLAEAVGAEPDVLELAGVEPVDELRADDSGVGAVELLDHQPDRALVERDVVVEDAEEAVVALDEAEDLVRRRPEPGVGRDLLEERVGEVAAHLLGQLRGDRVGLVDDEDERLEVG